VDLSRFVFTLLIPLLRNEWIDVPLRATGEDRGSLESSNPDGQDMPLLEKERASCTRRSSGISDLPLEDVSIADRPAARFGRTRLSAGFNTKANQYDIGPTAQLKFCSKSRSAPCSIVIKDKVASISTR
jgi:hypothetical protein